MSEKQRALDNLKNYLVPPGAGVFTVHTAKERKNSLQNILYESQGEDVEKIWKSYLEGVFEYEGPLLLGICSDAGGGILRGANWGPTFVREYFLNNHRTGKNQSSLDFLDIGDVKVNPHLLMDKYLNEETLKKCRKGLYGAEAGGHLAVSPLSITKEVVKTIYQMKNNATIFSIGGDHSVSYPLVEQYILHKKKLGKRVAILHFDAHTDLLDERLGIDICFGSWAYHILPLLNRPSDLIQIGIRASGKPKEFWTKKFGINQYWAYELEEKGPSVIVEDILKYLEREKIDEVYTSFDIDCLDFEYASATGTPESGGPPPHCPLLIMQAIYDEFPCTGGDIVEVAPFINHRDKFQEKVDGLTTTLISASSILDCMIQANLDMD